MSDAGFIADPASAVNVMRWIGQRIAMVEELSAYQEAAE